MTAISIRPAVARVAVSRRTIIVAGAIAAVIAWVIFRGQFLLPHNDEAPLFKALSVFALRGVDLTKLESRPIPGRPWEYLFYVDVAAARDNLACARALGHLAEFAPTLRMLGSYASWKSREERSPDPFEVVS